MNKTITCLLALASLTVLPYPAKAERLDNLTLQQSQRIALENHRSLQVSQAALAMAEAQYQQAMAAFRPRLGLEAGFQRADENRTFTFEGIVQTPAMGLTIGPGGAIVAIPGQPLPINSTSNCSTATLPAPASI
jgi:outer membrane protein TolC